MPKAHVNRPPNRRIDELSPQRPSERPALNFLRSVASALALPWKALHHRHADGQGLETVHGPEHHKSHGPHGAHPSHGGGHHGHGQGHHGHGGGHPGRHRLTPESRAEATTAQQAPEPNQPAPSPSPSIKPEPASEPQVCTGDCRLCNLAICQRSGRPNPRRKQQ